MTGRGSLSILRLRSEAALPLRAYGESAAFDLSAFLLNETGRSLTATLAPRTTKVIGTGLAMLPPAGHLILICSRSGLAARSIFVANAPGVVDPDYTGEIKVALFNGGLEPYYVKHEDRIAQALVVPFAKVDFAEIERLPETERGDRGFGSTGV